MSLAVAASKSGSVGQLIGQFGFVRVATAVPMLHLAEPQANTREIIQLLAEAEGEGADVVLFPELCLTGYTCGDLFAQNALADAAWEALEAIRAFTVEQYQGLAVVGLPVRHAGRLFNCAAVMAHGMILGLVPKTYLPNHQEFYEARHFASGMGHKAEMLHKDGIQVPFGVDILFQHRSISGLVVGVELCEDLWVPNPPSSTQAMAGATVLLNLSASNEVVGKHAYRRSLVQSQSGRCLAAYLYASSGVGESSSDLVFGGHALIAENGVLLAEGKRFSHQNCLLVADVDLEKLMHDRRGSCTFFAGFPQAAPPARTIGWGLSSKRNPAKRPLQKPVEPHPFVPAKSTTRDERCEEIFSIQVEGLARRLRQIPVRVVTLGVSGGLDSTLALLVAVAALDRLAMPRSQLLGLSMPGFGTTNRTHENAAALMRLLKIQSGEIDIRSLTVEELKAQEHNPFGIKLAGKTVEIIQKEMEGLSPQDRNDLVFENTQARIRTSLLMNKGFALGTGDLSELALGWCTYNADHMSMYSVNSSVPKTLVRFLVEWIATKHYEGELRDRLFDVAATPISPELLPTGPGGTPTQATEDTVGPYELHDFFLFHFLRYGSTPERVRWLALQAKFHGNYTEEDINRRLHLFVLRFFSQQYKRNCLPDGPKVGTVSLSPRGDWRMPADASPSAWLSWMSNLK